MLDILIGLVLLLLAARPAILVCAPVAGAAKTVVRRSTAVAGFASRGGWRGWVNQSRGTAPIEGMGWRGSAGLAVCGVDASHQRRSSPPGL